MSHRRVVGRKIGREPNDLCPCLSGRKYKKCCGSIAAHQQKLRESIQGKQEAEELSCGTEEAPRLKRGKIMSIMAVAASMMSEQMRKQPEMRFAQSKLETEENKK